MRVDYVTNFVAFVIVYSRTPSVAQPTQRSMLVWSVNNESEEIRKEAILVYSMKVAGTGQ
jgi:hypothetical protein